MSSKFKTGLDVRVGYPTEHLSSEAINEVNHPMFATSVGLVLKGFEYKEKNKNNKVKEPEPKMEESFEEEPELENKANRENKTGLITTLKKVFSDIFDEEDAEM